MKSSRLWEKVQVSAYAQRRERGPPQVRILAFDRMLQHANQDKKHRLFNCNMSSASSDRPLPL